MKKTPMLAAALAALTALTVPPPLPPRKSRRSSAATGANFLPPSRWKAPRFICEAAARSRVLVG